VKRPLRAEEDTVAYAIPSPARREHKGWVLPSVPLVAAAAQSERLSASAGTA
jgi:hypothetical protein